MTPKRPIESYEHKDKERVNNPSAGLVTPETDPDAGQKKKTYAYDPHLDPQLVWAGKAEHTSFEVPTVSLHVHERIEARTIIDSVRKRNGQPMQMSLFEEERQEPLHSAIEFYQHKHGWTNRLIAGDSLLVMNSLMEKEGMAGKVQMIYIDPPYGIKYGSNFQPFVNKRDVKNGKGQDLTNEPEQIRAFRDTWELGIHSYLTYLRDRLPILIAAKSAGDFTNTNKRRKEEAMKIHQLQATYGENVAFVLFLCGYFGSDYLGYEAAEGIDWVWEHRIDDLAKLGL